LTGRYCALLDEMEAVTELHRKSLIRLMRAGPQRKVRERQRGRSYGHEVDDVIRVVSESLDHICAERLTPSLAGTARLLLAHGELQVREEVLEQLAKISVRTVKRILRRIRQDERRLPRRGPERAWQMVREVPAQRIPWDMREPGHFEVDLVHHSGSNASGDYLHTLQMIDVATGWSERVAVLGRSALAMEAGFRRILRRLPFPILELHPDNGSEFLNHHIYRFFKDAVPGLRWSRSRPFQKDDNRFVEQKNQSLVRAYLGHGRLDSLAQAAAVNQLYDAMWQYYNLFQPVLRLQSKTQLQRLGERPHWQRRYDTAQTPLQRLCASGMLAHEQQAALLHQRLTVNPRRLHKEIYALLDQIATLPLADTIQDVHLAVAALAQPQRQPVTTLGLTTDRGQVDNSQKAQVAHLPTAPTTTIAAHPNLQKGAAR
jgi:hypothetical protein